MRDGVKIAVDLSLPAGLKDGERIPAILRQTRYFRSLDIGWPLSWLSGREPSAQKMYATHGYAWVDVDARGTGASFGRWPYPWAPDEVRDGSEVVDWIVKQPWSNGKVGAYGGSYEGGLAEFLLVNKNPAVKASFPAHAFFDAYADVAFPGGIRLSWFIKAWNQGNQTLDRDDVQQLFHDAPWWARPFLHGVKAVDEDRDRSLLKQAVQEHGTNGDIDAGSQVTFRDDVSSVTGVATDAFSPFTYTRDIEASGATVYSWSGWFDGGCTDSAIKRFRTLKNRGRLILGPWNHGASQDASPYSPASASAFNQDGELLRFFDDRLKGVNTGILQEKPVLYFTMGEERVEDCRFLATS
jgi:putative CocE/NonD family hydrolase